MDEAYQYYNEHVSGGNYPISLQLAEYLHSLCWETKPKYILDRGSGFSSFVFRRYAGMRQCTPRMLSIDRQRWLDIFTVDKKEHWLDKTKNFMAARGVEPYGYFYTWAEFRARELDQRKYDLIFEDYSFPDRVKSFSKVVNMLAEDGYLILDDAHDKTYRGAIMKVAKRQNLYVEYLIDQTLDEKGRHAALIRRRK